MFIDYYLASGQRILYDTGPGPIVMQHIDAVAKMYASANPDDLPDSVFMRVPIYGEFISHSFRPQISTVPADAGYQVLQVCTGCGLLRVYPLPMGWPGPEVIIGKREDLDGYDIDKVFEKIVLSGCERE